MGITGWYYDSSKVHDSNKNHHREKHCHNKYAAAMQVLMLHPMTRLSFCQPPPCKPNDMEPTCLGHHAVMLSN